MWFLNKEIDFVSKFLFFVNSWYTVEFGDLFFIKCTKGLWKSISFKYMSLFYQEKWKCIYYWHFPLDSQWLLYFDQGTIIVVSVICGNVYNNYIKHVWPVFHYERKLKHYHVCTISKYHFLQECNKNTFFIWELHGSFLLNFLMLKYKNTAKKLTQTKFQ